MLPPAHPHLMLLWCICRGAALLQLLCGYAERFGALLQGHSEDMPLSELMGGARIRHIFQVCYFGCHFWCYIVMLLEPMRGLVTVRAL
jgi:hypothetical protein